jgi:hypothetical protein
VSELQRTLHQFIDLGGFSGSDLNLGLHYDRVRPQVMDDMATKMEKVARSEKTTKSAETTHRAILGPQLDSDDILSWWFCFSHICSALWEENLCKTYDVSRTQQKRGGPRGGTEKEISNWFPKRIYSDCDLEKCVWLHSISKQPKSHSPHGKDQTVSRNLQVVLNRGEIIHLYWTYAKPLQCQENKDLQHLRLTNSRYG